MNLKKVVSYTAAAAILTTAVIRLSATNFAAAEATAMPKAIGFADMGSAAIDGANTGSEWDNVTTYPINRLMDGSESGADGTLQMKWDSDYLYVFVKVNDSTVSNTGDFDQSDSIQTYIDYDNCKADSYGDKDFQFEITRGGKVGDSSDCPTFSNNPSLLTNNITSHVTDTSTGYQVEYKLKLSAITGETLTKNKVIGFDLQINDCDVNSGTRLAAYGFSDNTNNAWQNPSAMGSVTLSINGGLATMISPSQAPVIDGAASDSVWNSATTYYVNRYKPEGGSDTGTNGTFKMLSDGTNIYLLIHVNDTSDDDMDRVATYIDFDNCNGINSSPWNDTSNYGQQDYLFSIRRNSTDYAADNYLQDHISLLDDNLTYRVARTNNDYTIEYKLNLNAIASAPITDRIIGFDLQIKDNGENTGYGWADYLNRAWIDVSSLGKIYLGSAVANSGSSTSTSSNSSSSAVISSNITDVSSSEIPSKDNGDSASTPIGNNGTSETATESNNSTSNTDGSNPYTGDNAGVAAVAALLLGGISVMAILKIKKNH